MVFANAVSVRQFLKKLRSGEREKEGTQAMLGKTVYMGCGAWFEVVDNLHCDPLSFLRWEQISSKPGPWFTDMIDLQLMMDSVLLCGISSGYLAQFLALRWSSV